MNFTCIACRVLFRNCEFQRLHYKTDWHRYNLKRKTLDLPPVTAEEFQNRVLEQRKENHSLLQDKSVYCNPCGKSFGNEKAYENHLNSKKHKENEKSIESVTTLDDSSESDTQKLNEPASNQMQVDNDDSDIETDSEVEEVDSDEWNEDVENPIDNNNCLFCNHHNRSLLQNIKHMSTEHTFFIPDIEYCTDVKGLLLYLGEKINIGFMCLWCNEKGKTFHNAEAARNHMLDKGHCKMLHEGITLAEYANYYDYSSSYPDNDAEGIDKNSEVSVPELDDSDYQLVLPSGAVIGHRSLMRYYQQNIDPNREIVLRNNTKKLHKVLVNYRALGWTATQQEAVARNARDLHHMKRLQSKYNMKLGVKGNKLQTHFRQQINF